MKVAIIILHFGDLKVTKNCIKSLHKYEKKTVDIIVVNNMSTTFSSDDFSKNAVHVINNKKNVGFAAGVNVGIRYALKKNYDAIVLLNNDTYLQKPLFDVLTYELCLSSIGIVAPAIRFKKNNHVLYDLGGKINMLTFRTSHEEVVKIRNKNPKSVEYVSGCCMMIKKNVFKKIGLFDENFFLYYEDADFCIRARRNGFAVQVVPSVVIDHELSKSTGKLSKIAIYNLTRSLIYFGKKYCNSGIKKYAQRIFVLYQSFVFFVKSPYGIYAWKAILES